MSLILTPRQRRVLGVLIEKCFTTPDQYPLTVNALISGCNQKSNRNPVMSLSEGDVINAAQELMHKKLIKLAATDRGARANRYEHDVTSQLPWSPREQAVLTELMLRGPQTVGELRTRSNRMSQTPDLQTIQNILDTFAAAEPPEVVLLPRAPGQSAVRYRHNFYTEDEQPEADSSVDASPVTPTSPDPALAERVGGLETRITRLESQIASLLGE